MTPIFERVIPMTLFSSHYSNDPLFQSSYLNDPTFLSGMTGVIRMTPFLQGTFYPIDPYFESRRGTPPSLWIWSAPPPPPRSEKWIMNCPTLVLLTVTYTTYSLVGCNLTWAMPFWPHILTVLPSSGNQALFLRSGRQYFSSMMVCKSWSYVLSANCYVLSANWKKLAHDNFFKTIQDSGKWIEFGQSLTSFSLKLVNIIIPFARPWYTNRKSWVDHVFFPYVFLTTLACLANNREVVHVVSILGLIFWTLRYWCDP